MTSSACTPGKPTTTTRCLPCSGAMPPSCTHRVLAARTMNRRFRPKHPGSGDGPADPLSPGVVPAQQVQGGVLVGCRDDAAEAAAHVEDLVHLLGADLAALLDQLEDRRRLDGVVEVPFELVGEAVEVAEAARGDVGEAAHVSVGAQQLE